jgi:hypothetical protein
MCRFFLNKQIGDSLLQCFALIAMLQEVTQVMSTVAK